MTFTINLPQATVDRIQASGKYVETYVKKAVEAKLALSKVSLKDALRPLQDAVEASGMNGAEAEAVFERELLAVRAERFPAQKTKAKTTAKR